MALSETPSVTPSRETSADTSPAATLQTSFRGRLTRVEQ